MIGVPGGSVWVFHAGALGDHVMIWPLVRAMARQGCRVTVVAAASHANLCEREVGQVVGDATRVEGVSAEQRRFTRLWSGEVRGEDVQTNVSAVVSFVADQKSTAGAQWWAGARRMFPGAELVEAGMPGSDTRREVWKRANVAEFGGVDLRENPGGAIVLFVGSGGEPKRWMMERWLELAHRLSGWNPARRVELLAGPVEVERMSDRERGTFEHAGGRWIGTRGLEELVEALRAARVYVGCDTGPTHLAAQLGVRTVALFGPTDPLVWAPVGARVGVISAQTTGAMSSLEVEDVESQVLQVCADIGD